MTPPPFSFNLFPGGQPYPAETHPSRATETLSTTIGAALAALHAVFDSAAAANSCETGCEGDVSEDSQIGLDGSLGWDEKGDGRKDSRIRG